MLDLPVVLVGAGAANLVAAAELAVAGVPVHIYEQNKAAGRKFLVAGHGGFNLSHSEHIDRFVLRYDKGMVGDIVRSFDNSATVRWLNAIGVPTYVGSSGKIFPEKGMKPIQVLQSILQFLEKHGVKIFYEHKMVNFDDHYVEFAYGNNHLKIEYRSLVFGMGGGSWAKTGSDSKWIGLFESKGIKVNAMQPANSGLNTVGNYAHLEGNVLKNIQLYFQDQVKAGEILFTNYGIEGAPVYYMNRFIRTAGFPTTLHIDLKPTVKLNELEFLLAQPKAKVANVLREKLRLNSVTIDLVKTLSKEVYMSPIELAQSLKRFPLQVNGFRNIDEVISTAGGVCFSELDTCLALRKFPRVFCVGEMLDWEAPTGGYLLQACFSTGFWAALKIKNAILKGDL